MCGRYDLNESPQMLMLYFILEAEPEPYNNPDVRPTNMAPIIHVHDGQRLALPARWGLIPSWSKDDKIAQHTFYDLSYFDSKNFAIIDAKEVRSIGELF